ncbi:YitT family protein [Paenibacillus sp. FSL R7-0345]|uniref:YczE/YyaS/YitT family protein n=1 Tax=Paenibacillus sp. FSL R7-0345 TaxID=2954535 RepID=UPI003159BFDA
MTSSRLRTALLFICGIFILTLGICLTIQSGLGASPFDATLVGLSGNVGLTVGSWEILIAILLTLCNAALTRRRPEMLGLATAFITGIGIDVWLFWLSDLVEPRLWISRLGCFAAGIVVTGLGTAVYLQANFAPAPLDRMTLVLQKLTGRSIFFTRTILYFVFLLAALIFNGPIGIGTLLTVCLGGFILNYFMLLIGKAVNRFSLEQTL